jgi:hypothetical protein
VRPNCCILKSRLSFNEHLTSISRSTTRGSLDPEDRVFSSWRSPAILTELFAFGFEQFDIRREAVGWTMQRLGGLGTTRRSVFFSSWRSPAILTELLASSDNDVDK